MKNKMSFACAERWGVKIVWTIASGGNDDDEDTQMG